MKNVINTLFFPPFLQRLDEKLLLERPSLWSTRLHRVAWPAFLLSLIAIMGGLLAPIHQPAALTDFVRRGAFLLVPLQVGLLIFWLYRQDAYHEAREFGVRGQKSVWQEFGASIAALVMVNLALFLFITTAQHRIRTLPKHTVARDMLVINSLDKLYVNRGNGIVCRHGEAGNNATCLNHTAETLIESDFREKRYIHSGYYKHTRFIQTYVSTDDILLLRDQWQTGDYELTMAIIAQYSGEPLSTVAAEWDIERNHKAHVREAQSTLFNDVHNLGYDLGWIGWFGIVIGAAAIHIALIRFTFKYAGGKWFFITIGSLVGLYIFGIFSSFFGYFFYELIDSFFDVFDRIDWSSNSSLNVGMVTLPFLLVALTLTTRLDHQSRFTTKTAIALYLLPLLLIGGSYLLLGIGEELAEVVYDGHLPYAYRRNNIILDASPREILTYLAQFGYIPFLGWLKRKHTHLIALPRQ